MRDSSSSICSLVTDAVISAVVSVFLTGVHAVVSFFLTGVHAFLTPDPILEDPQSYTLLGVVPLLNLGCSVGIFAASFYELLM
jgi:hypothetical protein